MPAKQKVLQAQIYHKRHFPKVNTFSYKLMYLALPLSRLDTLSLRRFFAVNRPALMSFWSKDHGDRTGENPRLWAEELLTRHNVEDADGEMILVTLPRFLGYVFNPVSFWMCYRKTGELRAVIAEVNNTFGETHSYLCALESGQNISSTDVFFAEKEFHVSPFLHRRGCYQFKFDTEGDVFCIDIDYFDEDHRLQLQTSIAASRHPWSVSSLMLGWLKSPLMAFKAIFLIHWQALKLVCKSAGYKTKPEQHTWFQTRAREYAPFDIKNNQ